MYWWIPMAAGAALGALKNAEEGKAAAANDKVEAVRELWSPWTGVHSKGNTKKSSQMGDIGLGAISGLAQGQAFDRAQKPESFGQAPQAAVDSDFNKYGNSRMTDQEAQNLWSNLSPEQQREIAAKAQGR